MHVGRGFAKFAAITVVVLAVMLVGSRPAFSRDKNDTSNAIHEVRSNGLEWTPFQTLRSVSYDVLRCRIQAVRHGTPRCFRPETRQQVVGSAAKQHVAGLAVHLVYYL